MEDLPPPGKANSIQVARQDGDGRRYELFYELWAPEKASTVKPIYVVFLPGVHESADTVSVRRMSKAFTDAGFFFCCFEHHGHGRSVGPKDTLGLVESFDLLCEHAKKFIELVIPENAGFILSGHSMGGAVAAYVGDELLQTYGNDRFLGEILLSPAVLGASPGSLTHGALRVVAKIVPKLPIGPPEDVSVYDTKSGLGLNYSGNMRARTALILLDLFENTRKQMQSPDPTLKMDFPFIAFNGDKDGVVPLQKVKAFVEYAKTSQKSFVEVPRTDHQLLLGPNYKTVLQRMVEWAQKNAANNRH